MALGHLPTAAFSLGHLTLGRVIIAAFMVALLLGPRRWMLWASLLRARRPTAAVPPATKGSESEPAATDRPKEPAPRD
jgi:hypothetical protein